MREDLFSEIVFSSEFKTVMQAAIEKPLLKTEFDNMPLPDNCDRENVWDFLQLIQYMAGTIDPVKPWFNGEHDHCWYYFPKTVQKQLSNISSLCSPTSILNVFLNNHPDSFGIFIDLLSEEITACGRRDGMTISATQVRSILSNEQKAQKPEEIIVDNFRRLFVNMPRITKTGTVSRLLIGDLNNQLLSNSSLDRMPTVNIWDASLCNFDLLNDPNYAADVSDSVIEAMRNATEMNDIIIAYLRSYKLLHCVKYTHQLPCLTEFLFRRAFTLIKKVPILGFAPVVYYEDTHNNKFRKAHENEVEHGGKEGLCCTWDYAGSINMLFRAVKDIENEINNAQEKEKKIKIFFSNVPELSSRQKAFLTLASFNRARHFSIKFYQNRYSVCYSTARNELMELYEKGFLSIQKQGRSFTFHSSHVIS